MHAWSQSQIANSNSSFGGEGLEDGGVARVGEVGEEIVDGAGAGVLGLEPGAHDGEHGEAAVLDLLGSQLLDLLRRAAAPAERVKPQATRVP